jgi:hypothetical protein
MNSTGDKKDIYDNVSSSLLFKISFAAIAVIGSIVTIYAAFFQEKVIQVQFVVTANSNVLDINTEISKVDILYDSTSLKQSNKNLRIYNIKVINNGEADVLKTFFDENEPLGILIKNGEIVEKPEITETSSSYLQKTLKAIQKNHNQIEFSNVILESDEYFSIKILVLHKNSVNPQLVPIGKIAGQKQINLINASEVKIERPFFIETFSGNIWAQLVRLIAYFIIIVIIIVIIVASSEKIDSIKTSKKRKKNIKDFKSKKEYSHNKMNDAIFTRYDNFGGSDLVQMVELIQSEELLNETYKKGIQGVKNKKETTINPDYILSHRFNIVDNNLSIIKSMIHDGLVFNEKDKLIVNQPMKSCLIMYVDFLKERKALRERYRPLPPMDLNDTDKDR